MYSKRINYVLVGSFVVAMLVVAVITVATLAGRTGPTDRYYVLLDNVTDIKYGTQVRFEGFPVGQIERIEAAEPGAGKRFQLEISVIEGWRMPADSVARIGNSSFLAAKTLDIQSGTSADLAAPGAQIASANPDDMFTTMRAAAGQLTALSEGSVKPLLATLQALISTVNADTPLITRELTSFTQNLNASLVPIRDILADENIQSIARALANTESTTATLADASNDLALAMRKLNHIATNLDVLVESNDTAVEQTLKDLQYTLATVARSVDTIVHNFDGTARHMNEFSRLIRTNPGVLLGGTPREAVSEAKADKPKAPAIGSVK
jgi:phospholipid/cholesterol/gamma-HCH transport system substrate-binding protein